MHPLVVQRAGCESSSAAVSPGEVIVQKFMPKNRMSVKSLRDADRRPK